MGSNSLFSLFKREDKLYSQISELRANVIIMTETEINDPIVTDRIGAADKKIKADLSAYIDFTDVPADSTDTNFPVIINILSQYKTAELCLVYKYGKKRNVDDNSDINYWRTCYDNMIEDIKNEDVSVELEDGTSLKKGNTTFSKLDNADINAPLGIGRWSERLTDDEREEKYGEVE